MNINEKFTHDYDKYSFGNYIRKRREELGISCRQLAIKLEISAAYLSDIELGHRNAPLKTKNGKDYLLSFIQFLQINESELPAFYAMADAARTTYPDIEEYLVKNQLARTAVRLAKDIDLSDDEWQNFIAHLQEIKSKKQIT